MDLLKSIILAVGLFFAVAVDAAIVSGAVALRLSVDRPIGLGRDSCQAGSIVVTGTDGTDGTVLVEGVDFTVNLPACEVLALRPLDGLVLATFAYEDHSEARAAETAAAEQDRARLAAAVAQAIQALDQVDSDVAALAAAPDASLDTVAKLRAALRTLGRDVGRLAAIHRRIVRWAGRQAGAAVPAEQ